MLDRFTRLSNEFKISKTTREAIMPLVLSSSILSPYETECDSIFYGVYYDNQLIGYASGRITPQSKILAKLSKKESVFINGMEIIKKYRNHGLGSKLFNAIKHEYDSYPILLYATRFSVPFWLKQQGAKEVGTYGKGKYITFENNH